MTAVKGVFDSAVQLLTGRTNNKNNSSRPESTMSYPNAARTEEPASSKAQDKVRGVRGEMSGRINPELLRSNVPRDPAEARRENDKYDEADNSHTIARSRHRRHSSKVAVPDIFDSRAVEVAKPKSNLSMMKSEQHGANASQSMRELLEDSEKKIQLLQEKNRDLEVANQKLSDANAGMTKAQEEEVAKLKDQIQRLTNQNEFFRHAFKSYASAKGYRDIDPKLVHDLLNDALAADELRGEIYTHQKELDAFREQGSRLWEQINEFQREVASREKREVAQKQQIHALHQQLHALQQQLFSTVEKVSAIPDEQMTQAFRLLAATIKNLSRSIRIPEGSNILDIEAIASSLLVYGVNKELWLARGRKKCLIEAFIWSVLLQHVFCNPFAVFGPSCRELGIWWVSLFAADKTMWPDPEALAERWRYTTIERMMSMKETITRGVVTQEGSDVQASIVQVRELVGENIHGPLSQISPATDFSAVGVIIDKAFTLALEMSLQRCRLQVIRPEVGDYYRQGDSPHLKSALENEDLQEGCVAFVINPGLEKWGDGHGKSLDQKLVLVPCEVFIQPVQVENCTPMEGLVSMTLQSLKNGYERIVGPVPEDQVKSVFKNMSPEDSKVVGEELYSQSKEFEFEQAQSARGLSESPSQGVSLI